MGRSEGIAQTMSDFWERLHASRLPKLGEKLKSRKRLRFRAARPSESLCKGGKQSLLRN
jgi:hypothetical protein